MGTVTIGKLADAAQVGIDTVRFYERAGLLKKPQRTAAGYRLYAESDVVFIGEAVSIGVMEVAMNIVDYAMGGMGVKSLFVARYWDALTVASVAGFLAAWPVNFWLLGRNVKKCH
jgi:hypothetical protein